MREQDGYQAIDREGERRHRHGPLRASSKDRRAVQSQHSEASLLYAAWEEQLLQDIVRYLRAAHADLVDGRTLLQAQLVALEQIATHIIRALTATGNSDAHAFASQPITRRQRQILLGLNSGQRPQEIARELGISEKTVRTHIRDSCDRLEVSGAFAAVQAAKALHIIP